MYQINKYKFLTEAITRLETHGMTVPDQMAILKSVQDKLSDGDLAKLERVLAKNPDLNFFDELPADKKILCEYIPLVSVEVERSFSMYTYILSDNRQSFTESNLAKLNVIQFNNFIEDEK